MAEPSASATIVFTDIEGSTVRWEAEPEAMGEALATHDHLLRTTVEHAGGTIVKHTGDGLLALFERPEQAVAATRTAQERLAVQPWPTAEPLRVRMGVHTGEVRWRAGDVFGPDVNLAARVADAGRGGQVVVSATTADLLSEGATSVQGRYRLDGVGAPQELHLLVEHAGPDASLRALQVERTNLPADLDLFVERQEVLQTAERVDAHRLTTVCGPGGSGKSRLAARVGARASDLMDGVWIVDLVAATEHADVPHAVAETIGARTSAGRPLLEQLVDHVREREMLLIFDSCELLLEPAARCIELLLSRCPELKVLATSREVLDLPGEQVIRLRGLALPPADQPVEEQLDAPACRLFVARAEADGHRRIGPADAELVASICRSVDGLPLGIELAAAQLGSLGLAELPAHLAETGARRRRAGRTGSDRHSSLDAVVAASWALVDEADRPALERLGAFAGAFTVDAAATVCESPRSVTTERLATFVDTSLLVASEVEGIRRFRMLDTIRRYARQRLHSRGIEQHARDQHLRWAAGRITELEGAMRTSAQETALAGARPEHDDLRAARAWALEVGDLESALRITASAPIDAESQRDTLLRRLLDEVGEVGEDLRARSLYTCASAAIERGDWASLQRFGDEAAEAFQRAGDPLQAGFARMMAALGRWSNEPDADLEPELQDLQGLFSDADDLLGQAYVDWVLGQWRLDRAEDRADLLMAREVAEASAQRFEQSGSSYGWAHAAEGMAYALVQLGELEDASRWVLDGLDSLDHLGNVGCVAHLLDAVAVVAAARGAHGEAAELVGAAETLRAKVGAALRPWELAHRRRCVEQLRLTLPGGQLHDCIERGRELPLASAVEQARTMMASDRRS